MTPLIGRSRLRLARFEEPGELTVPASRPAAQLVEQRRVPQRDFGVDVFAPPGLWRRGRASNARTVLAIGGSKVPD